MLTHSAQNDSEQASEKAKFAQKASQRAEQGKNAKPSLAQSLNPKRDFALRSKKPAEPQRQASAERQKQGLLVILSDSEVSTNLKCGLHLKVWIFRYAQNDSEPSEQGKVCSKSEPSQPSKPKKPAQKAEQLARQTRHGKQGTASRATKSQ